VSGGANKRTTPREHGTQACYVFGEWGGDSKNGCRCDACKDGNRARYYERKARVEPPLVSAGPAREHCRWLATQGVGLKQIVKASGVSQGAVWKLMYGKRQADGTQKPSKRIHPDLAAKILAVTPSQGAEGSRVPAGPVHEMVARLVAAGVPKVRIAERCGQGRSLQIGEQYVTRRTARTIADMVAELEAGTLVSVRYTRHGQIRLAPDAPEREDEDPQNTLRDHVTLALVELLEDRIDQNHWRREAACRGRPPWMFFPARGDHKSVAAAKKVCGACFVRAECLAANLHERDGVYGGLSARERRDLRAREAVAS
jgi:hypothetical protein